MEESLEWQLFNMILNTDDILKILSDAWYINS